jgi:hypothetical protein
MADLSKIDDKYDFNSACYTGGELTHEESELKEIVLRRRRDCEVLHF